MITEPKALIAALGGPASVAEWAGVTCSAVCQWLKAGHIPHAHRLPLLVECQNRQIAIDAHALFGVRMPALERLCDVGRVDFAPAFGYPYGPSAADD